MRKISILLIVLFILPLASAEIFINQPEELYNLGDPMSFSATIKSPSDVNGFFTASLICNGVEQEFYKEYVFLRSGEEKKMNPSILLMKSIVKLSNGVCKIKASFNSDYVLTNEFVISDKITLTIRNEQREFIPGESIIVSGEAIKENGDFVDGIVEMKVNSNEGEIEDIFETVDNGYFGINLTFDEKQKAGTYSINIDVHEKDRDGEVTNIGIVSYDIVVLQVPRSLELILDNKEVVPGKEIMAKAILHDQSGESIATRVNITIKDHTNKIRLEEEKNTDEFAVLSTEYKEAPGEWKVIAVYDNFISELPIVIKDNIAAEFSLENNTLTVINKGNVPYIKTVYVNLQNETREIAVSLKVGESKDFRLTAPDGVYDVEVSGDGADTIKKKVYLEGNEFKIGPTGFATNLKESSSNVFKLVKQPFSWFLIILILGITAMFLMRKTDAIKRINIFSRKKNIPLTPIPDKKVDAKSLQTGFPGLKNGAVLLLSLNGDRQTTVAVCLKVKNPSEIKDATGSGHEIIKKIVDRAEQKKAVFYESGDYLFLMLVPIRTKTFDNERAGIYLAEEINEMLKDYNRKFKQRINYGISVHKGEIIAKDDQGIFKFAALGNIINANKRYSTLAGNEEILISKEINDKVMSLIRSDRSNKEQGLYVLKEIKEREDHKKFISRFVQRQKIEGNRNMNMGRSNFNNTPKEDPEKLKNLLKREEDGDFIDLS